MSRTLQNHYLRILRLWPTDILRPITVQSALRTRLRTQFVQPAAHPETNVEANGALASIPPKLDEAAELAQMNAMYSLLENRYAKQYAASEALMRPGFNPDYYEALAHEMDEAPKRSWLQNQWLRWGSIVRFS